MKFDVLTLFPEQIEENVKVTEFASLSAEELAEIDRILGE